MPLDPNKFYQKKPNLEQSAIRPAVLLAIESCAIIVAGMLAVVFLCWALAVQSSPDPDSFTGEQVPHANGEIAPF